MGNKLCAPFKKGYRDEDHPWAPKKDSHLLRLWAEIFEVRVDGDDVYWARVSDDVVPVNITCIQDTPETVFQITAYNRHVEKIFDCRLIQPGTRITQASECFVHWRDSRYDNEWGLNFTTPVDARRFRDCCMSPANKIARKASSSGSLRLSPPKRVRGSSRKATSNPTSPVSQPRRAISTPEELALQDAIDAGFVVPPGSDDRSPSVDSSQRSDGQSTLQRQQRPPRGGGIYEKTHPASSDYESPYAVTRQRPHSDTMGNSVNQRQQMPRDLTEPIYATVRNVKEAGQEEETDSNANLPRKLSKPEIRQFSREPTVLRLATDPEGTDPADYPVNEIKDDISQIMIQIKDTKLDGKKMPLSPPRKSLSSSSPEWPPPPDPITPISPETPIQNSFDSNTLRKMLRNLAPAETSPESNGNRDSMVLSPEGQPQSTSSSPIRGSAPQQTNPNPGGRPVSEGPCSHLDLAQSNPSPDGRPPIPARPHSYVMECRDISGRAAKSRDSYPDSGIGLTNDISGSVKSGDSGKSAKSNRSASLPLGTGSNHGPRSTTSSGSSGRHSDLVRHMSGSETTELRQLTSSDISDSESESTNEGSTSDSSIHTMPSESQASFASKSAAVRRAGWLTVKNWLIHKKRKVELAPKRTWKKYWVCLKGTMLLFYTCDEGGTVREGSVPRHMLVIEGGIAQSVPEHPKRECIFALSTAFGDAYLFQAQSQIELENWVNALHSACASSFARQHGKENTLKLLKTEVQKLENSIDIDIKMKKMADLQLTVVSDPRSKQAIEKQIAQWDENLEKLYIEQYRLRCYAASLQGSELPNPKTLLTYVSRGTKGILGRVGVFTVTSFHALVCARTPLTTANLYQRGRKRGLLSTFKADSNTKLRPRSPRSFSPPSGNHMYKSEGDQVLVDFGPQEEEEHEQPVAPPPEMLGAMDNLVRIVMPNGQTIVLGISDKMTVGEVLEAACNRRQLNANDHFLRIKLANGNDSYKIPEKSSCLDKEECESLEVCAKILFQMELSRATKDPDFGMQVEAELAEDTEREDELCIFISDVTKGGLAQRKGLIVGDEILVIDGKVVTDLDMVYVETILQESEGIVLTVRSCRCQRPVNTTALMEHADIYIDNMVCPPPPTQSRISDKVIGEMIVPAPNLVNMDSGNGENSDDSSPRPAGNNQLSSFQIDHLLEGAEQVTHFCRLLHQHQPMPDTMNTEEPPPVKPLSAPQKLRKVIMELIDTERHYVKDLMCLIERYLEPLKEENFLSGEDIEQLFGNIQEIVQFQKMFLQSLEEAVELEPDFNILTEPSQFRRILFSLGGSFLYYANHFKLYSSFCASHSKAQKVLNPDYQHLSDSNQQLREFLRARNPKQQHSATLESYLIKPIQRILKYPLLLQQLKQLTDPHTDEHLHLAEALRGMEAVAGHINEMQKIYEEYGNIFDDLMRQYRETHPHNKFIDLNVGDLQMYGTVTWLNALDELGKLKKGMELLCMVFVFKAGIVLLAQERNKIKKKGNKEPPRKPAMGPLELGNITLYQTVIPVDQLQVRCTGATDTERHGFWELVHCRSETEGRPERVFQLASSLAAKNEFMRTLRNIIRESVRRMQLPSTKQNGKVKTLPQQHSPQYGPPGTRRPDNLIQASQPPWTVGKKRGKQLKGDMVRHSMDLEEKYGTTVGDGGSGSGGSSTGSTTGHPGGVGVGPDFRTRSRTFSDLNNMDLGAEMGCDPGGSQSTLASERGSTSAKLLHSSHNPSNYSSSTTLHKDSLGSPIWKPRNAKKHVTVRSPGEERALEASIFAGSAYGDYSEILYDEPRAVMINAQNSYANQQHINPLNANPHSIQHQLNQQMNHTHYPHPPPPSDDTEC